MSLPVAAIDLGTNTVLMLIARLDDEGRFSVIEDRCEDPRLGAGLARTGRLDEAAAQRTLRVLEQFARELGERGIERCRVVGTAVLRRAADAEEFVARVQAACGLRVEVIPEQEEARLGYQAVVAEGGRAETLIVDVGGGSTEIVGRGGEVRMSAPVGAVVLTETYLGLAGSEPTRSGGFPALLVEAKSAVSCFPAGLAEEGLEVVCLGGSASNLACLGQDLLRYESERAEGYILPVDIIPGWVRRLHALPLEERLKLPIEASRAEILPAGLACMEAALSRIGARTIRVSGKGIRYGVARELLVESAP
ncbi:MAG: hypothetical protein V2A76_06810 [Planctomycetota bacterium]